MRQDTSAGSVRAWKPCAQYGVRLGGIATMAVRAANRERSRGKS